MHGLKGQVRNFLSRFQEVELTRVTQCRSEKTVGVGKAQCLNTEDILWLHLPRVTMS